VVKNSLVGRVSVADSPWLSSLFALEGGGRRNSVGKR
jgi:hypothetical protein